MTRSPGRKGLQLCPRRLDTRCRHFQHGMGVLAGDPDSGVDGGAQLIRETVKVLVRIGRLDGQLLAVACLAAVDGDARAVRPAVGHGDQHVGQHLTKLRLKRLVLEEQTNNSAHLAQNSS
jgi:hypothetical protein